MSIKTFYLDYLLRISGFIYFLSLREKLDYYACFCAELEDWKSILFQFLI